MDYDLTTKTSRRGFYITNWFPMWTNSYNLELSKFYGDKVVEYLARNNIVNSEDFTLNYLGMYL